MAVFLGTISISVQDWHNGVAWLKPSVLKMNSSNIEMGNGITIQMKPLKHHLPWYYLLSLWMKSYGVAFQINKTSLALLLLRTAIYFLGFYKIEVKNFQQIFPLANIEHTD